MGEHRPSLSGFTAASLLFLLSHPSAKTVMMTQRQSRVRVAPIGGTMKFAALVLLACACRPSTTHAEFVFTIFSVPGSTVSSARDINDAGLAVGDFFDARDRHGYLRDAAGTFTTFDAPGSETFGRGINNFGSVTGAVRDSTAQGFHAYIRAADGTFITFDAPGSTRAPGAGTFGNGINDAGLVVGSFFDDALHNHGFVRLADGTIASFDVPGSSGTIIGGIDNLGRMTGAFTDLSFLGHGFVRDIDGSVLIFNVPGSRETFGLDINDAGQVTGNFFDSRGVIHGFVRNVDGGFLTVDAPGSRETQSMGINNRGQLAGDLAATFAFIATPAAIPEPSSLILFGTGLGGWLGYRRRKGNHHSIRTVSVRPDSELDNSTSLIK